MTSSRIWKAIRLTRTTLLRRITRVHLRQQLELNQMQQAVPALLVIKLPKSSTRSTPDTGELRYALDAAGPLAAGRLEVAVKRLDDTLGDGDAFITLFNTNTNNDGAILDFRIRDDSFGVRSPSGIDTSTLPHTLDAFMDVVVTWEYPGDPATTLPAVTITVDGVSLAPFTPDEQLLQWRDTRCLPIR